MNEPGREIEQPFVDRDGPRDYAVPDELEYWTATDFEDVLATYTPLAADEH